MYSAHRLADLLADRVDRIERAFETMLGLAAHHEPASYWDVIGRANPRQGNVVLRRVPRRRKTETGMRQDGSASAQTKGQNQALNAGVQLNMDEPGTTQ